MKTTHFLKPVKSIAFLFLCGMLAWSCSDDDPAPVNEEETITRVTLTFTAGATVNTYVYNVDETIPEIFMEQGTTYEVSITFEDASDPSDIEDITEEVEVEANDHYVFYQITDASIMLENAADDVQDTDGISIGLHTEWSTTGVANGSVTVYLIHQPTSKTGTVRDDFGGEDDVQVTFPVNIIK